MNKRLEHIRKLLASQSCDAILISSVPTIVYFTGYSGFSEQEREAYILVTQKHAYIFTDARYSEAVYQKIPHFTLQEISAQSPLKKLLKELTKTLSLNTVGFEETNITVAEYKKLKLCFKSFKPIDITNIRLIKNTDEIKKIQAACQLGDKTFDYILPIIKEGITEKEVAFAIEFFIKSNGGELSFPTIAAFGSNASIPHHQTGDKKLEKNNFVLLDFGVRLENYCSDMTRTVFFGKATEKQKKMYQSVLDAQQKSIDLLKTQNSKHKVLKATDIDNVARQYIIQQGFPSIPHSVGHGTGIEVHETPHLSPKSKDILIPGMVFSIEPGIYIPGFGGVRIEDLVVLEKSGPRLLTKSPRNFIEL